jgi:hypothetical protein
MGEQRPLDRDARDPAAESRAAHGLTLPCRMRPSLSHVTPRGDESGGLRSMALNSDPRALRRCRCDCWRWRMWRGGGDTCNRRPVGPLRSKGIGIWPSVEFSSGTCRVSRCAARLRPTGRGLGPRGGSPSCAAGLDRGAQAPDVGLHAPEGLRGRPAALPALEVGGDESRGLHHGPRGRGADPPAPPRAGPGLCLRDAAGAGAD